MTSLQDNAYSLLIILLKFDIRKKSFLETLTRKSKF